MMTCEKADHTRVYAPLNKPSLVQILDCGPVGTKALPEPMFT